MNTDFRVLVAQAEERLRQAMVHSDSAILDELISPDLIFTNHLGQLVDKKDDIAVHRSGALKFDSLNPSEQHIHTYEGFAVVSVVMHLAGKYESTPLDLSIRYTRVWQMLPSGLLQIVAGHAGAVPSIVDVASSP